MIHHGFARVAAFSPVLRVADPGVQLRTHRRAPRAGGGRGRRRGRLPRAVADRLQTCADLFTQATLLRAALRALHDVTEASRTLRRAVRSRPAARGR